MGGCFLNRKPSISSGYRGKFSNCFSIAEFVLYASWEIMNDLMSDYNDDNRIINMGANESHNGFF
jgi:hypothetical protein